MACEEIVRCMAHLGRNRKQTLFLFILPSCMKRLEAFNPRFTNCSLIAIFATKLVTVQISKLLHIFWVMNRSSLFSPVFSEIDQKGALLLLSNIRPEIMQQTNDLIQNMMTGAGATVSTLSQSVSTSGQSVSTSSQSGRTEVSESSTARSVSVTTAEVTISSSSPVVSTVASTGHQPVTTVNSRRDSTSTSSNATTSVVSSMATPVCSILPRTEVVSIRPTPTITSVVMPAVTSNSHASTHSTLQHPILDGPRVSLAEWYRGLLSVNSTASTTPPISTPTTVCLGEITIAASTPVPTDSETTAQDMSIGHLQQSPVCMYVPTFLTLFLFL